MGTSTSVWIVSLFCSMFNLNGSTILMNFLPWLRKQNKWKPGGDPKWNDLWIHFLVYNVLRSTETSCWVLKLLGTGRSSIGWSQGLPVRYIAGISSASLSQKPHMASSCIWEVAHYSHVDHYITYFEDAATCHWIMKLKVEAMCKEQQIEPTSKHAVSVRNNFSSLFHV